MGKKLKASKREYSTARKQFFDDARKTAKILKNKRKRLKSDLETMSKKAKRNKVRYKKQNKRLAKADSKKARKKLKVKLTRLAKAMKSSRSRVKNKRQELQLVKESLAGVRLRIAHAKYLDKSMVLTNKLLKKIPKSKKPEKITGKEKTLSKSLQSESVSDKKQKAVQPDETKKTGKDTRYIAVN